jgi:alkanesulfonate monooxygenase SsuD/methylene tetrahydromethanopterin reductase-like flavin-dependent oxidoreductase (luciferase family)
VRIRVNLLTAIRDTREEALRWAGPMLALRLQQPAWLEQAGIDPGPVQAPSGLSGLYPDPMHPEDHEAAMDIAEQIPLELREQIAAASGLIGTPEDCLSRLQALHELGFDDVFLRSVDTVSFPEPEARLFGTKLRPALVERGLVG